MSGNKSGRHWKFPAIFNGSDSRLAVKEPLTSKLINEPVQHVEHAYSMIHLKEVHNFLLVVGWNLYLVAFLVNFSIALTLISFFSH